jgi:hypothetical protein
MLQSTKNTFLSILMHNALVLRDRFDYNFLILGLFILRSSTYIIHG